MELEKWSNFFTDFKSFWVKEETVPIDIISKEKSEKLFQDFSLCHTAYTQKGLGLNVFEPLPIGRNEVQNSYLLAWFLNCFASHGQGNSFLKALFSENKEEPIYNFLNDKNYRTYVENVYDEEIKSRVDIEIEGKEFLLFIEVKIDAQETGNQLERYLDIIQGRAGKRPWALIFLSPSGRQAQNVDLHSKILPLSWKRLAKAFQEHIKTMPETFAKEFLQQSCRHFATL